MKLEIKHLAIAFTNNWKVTYFDDERELNQVCNIVELREDECTISNGEYQYDVKFEGIKLLCFPLSSLTKDEMKNITKSDFNRYSEDYLDTILNTMKREINSKKLPYYLMEKLFERKFDVFGLIDAGLAEPVTEDFTPYK